MPSVWFRLKNWTAYTKKNNLKNKFLWIRGNSNQSSTNIRKRFSFKKLKENLLFRTNYSKIELDILNVVIRYFKKYSILNINHQRNLIKAHSNWISLDSEIKLDYNLRISRLFGPLGINKIGFYVDEKNTNLPENKSIDYTIFDDDIATGSTLKYVIGYLKSLGYIWKQTIVLSSSKKSEILDGRDFLIEFENVGLMTQLPNGDIVRVPYILPFVSPFIRANISNSKEFSERILDLNIEYWSQFPDKKPKYQNKLWKFLQIEHMTNLEICLYLRNHLRNHYK